MENISFISVVLFLCTIAFVSHVSTHAQPMSSNVTNFSSKIDDFYRSITKIASLNDNKFKQVSLQINEIGVKLNQSTSECYEAITKTFNYGFNTSWSSKSKLFYVKETTKVNYI